MTAEGEDQPDPRVMLAAEAIASRYQDSPRQYLGDAQRVVDALDRADRAAGIRRVKWPERQNAEVGAWWTADKRGEGVAHKVAAIDGFIPASPTGSNLPSYDLRWWTSTCGLRAPFLFSMPASATSERCEWCSGS